MRQTEMGRWRRAGGIPEVHLRQSLRCRASSPLSGATIGSGNQCLACRHPGQEGSLFLDLARQKTRMRSQAKACPRPAELSPRVSCDAQLAEFAERHPRASARRRSALARHSLHFVLLFPCPRSLYSQITIIANCIAWPAVKAKVDAGWEAVQRPWQPWREPHATRFRGAGGG